MEEQKDSIKKITVNTITNSLGDIKEVMPNPPNPTKVVSPWFNMIIPHNNNIKTIILKSPEECLNYQKILDDLIKKGYQILPSALYPNEIRISYIDPDNNINPNNIIKNPNWSLLS